LFITASFLRRGLFYRLVGFSRAKRASNQRMRGGAEMVMNKIANGGPAECSCAGHSTRRAQHPGLRIAFPSIITSWGTDLWRENPWPWGHGTQFILCTIRTSPAIDRLNRMWSEHPSAARNITAYAFACAPPSPNSDRSDIPSHSAVLMNSPTTVLPTHSSVTICQTVGRPTNCS